MPALNRFKLMFCEAFEYYKKNDRGKSEKVKNSKISDR